MTSTIGIMGCGWLGYPLARVLVNQGYAVRGSTTSKTKLTLLETAGIEPYLISLGEEGIEGPITSFLIGMDILIINVPPGLRGGKSSNYVFKMKALHDKIRSAGVPKVVFVSSTSVYGSVEGSITEETPPNPNSESGHQLLQAENLFRKDNTLRTSIVRFGGLIGPERHPSRQLAGRKGLKNGHHPVNLIHLEDCLSVISTILEHNWWDTIFNGVYPEHPSKGNYYRTEAEKRGLQAPEYDEEEDLSQGKIVDSAALAERGFTFSKGIWS